VRESVYHARDSSAVNVWRMVTMVTSFVMEQGFYVVNVKCA
jgi:hypothetical protein